MQATITAADRCAQAVEHCTRPGWPLGALRGLSVFAAFVAVILVVALAAEIYTRQAAR